MPTLAQIAMAERICNEHQPRTAYDAALIAIVETTEAAARLAERLSHHRQIGSLAILTGDDIATELRAGEHLKDSRP